MWPSEWPGAPTSGSHGSGPRPMVPSPHVLQAQRAPCLRPHGQQAASSVIILTRGPSLHKGSCSIEGWDCLQWPLVTRPLTGLWLGHGRAHCLQMPRASLRPARAQGPVGGRGGRPAPQTGPSCCVRPGDALGGGQQAASEQAGAVLRSGCPGQGLGKTLGVPWVGEAGRTHCRFLLVWKPQRLRASSPSCRAGRGQPSPPSPGHRPAASRQGLPSLYPTPCLPRVCKEEAPFWVQVAWGSRRGAQVWASHRLKPVSTTGSWGPGKSGEM